MTEEKIELIANVKNWVCIKKGKIDSKTEDVEISRILASIIDSIDKKSWDFLSKDFDLKNLEEIAAEITGATQDKKGNYEIKGRVTDEMIAKSLAMVNNPSTTKKLSEKNVNVNSAKEISKAYLTSRVLDILKVRTKLDPKLIEKYAEETHKKKIGL